MALWKRFIKMNFSILIYRAKVVQQQKTAYPSQKTIRPKNDLSAKNDCD